MAASVRSRRSRSPAWWQARGAPLVDRHLEPATLEGDPFDEQLLVLSVEGEIARRRDAASVCAAGARDRKARPRPPGRLNEVVPAELVRGGA
jgi:hypothetical protein